MCVHLFSRSVSRSLRKAVWTEEIITALREVIFISGGWLEMLLCIVVAASLFNIGLFLLFHRKVKKRFEREIAF